MSKFKVTIEEIAVYEIEVEAEDADDACTQAEEVFVQSEDINEFFMYVKERDATDVEPLEPVAEEPDGGA